MVGWSEPENATSTLLAQGLGLKPHNCLLAMRTFLHFWQGPWRGHWVPWPRAPQHMPPTVLWLITAAQGFWSSSAHHGHPPAGRGWRESARSPRAVPSPGAPPQQRSSAFPRAPATSGPPGHLASLSIPLAGMTWPLRLSARSRIWEPKMQM